MTLRILLFGSGSDLRDGDVWRYTHTTAANRWWETSTLLPDADEPIEIARIYAQPSSLKEWFNG